jgi:predicted thioesterase
MAAPVGFGEVGYLAAERQVPHGLNTVGVRVAVNGLLTAVVWIGVAVDVAELTAGNVTCSEVTLAACVGQFAVGVADAHVVGCTGSGFTCRAVKEADGRIGYAGRGIR